MSMYLEQGVSGEPNRAPLHAHPIPGRFLPSNWDDEQSSRSCSRQAAHPGRVMFSKGLTAEGGWDVLPVAVLSMQRICGGSQHLSEVSFTVYPPCDLGVVSAACDIILTLLAHVCRNRMPAECHGISRERHGDTIPFTEDSLRFFEGCAIESESLESSTAMSALL